MAITLRTAWTSVVNTDWPITLAYGSALAADSLLVAVVATKTNTNLTSVSDGTNGAWTVIATRQNEAVLGWDLSFAYFAGNASTGTPTVSVTTVENYNTKALFIAEYAGVATASAVDGTPTGAAGTSSAPLPGNITSTGDAVFIGASIQYSEAAPTVQTDYTARVTATALEGSTRMFIADLIKTGAATSNPGYTSTQSYWAALGQAFKSAAGGSIIPQAMAHLSARHRR